MLAGKQRKGMYKKREPEKERGKTGKGRELDAILAFLTPSPTLFIKYGATFDYRAALTPRNLAAPVKVHDHKNFD